MPKVVIVIPTYNETGNVGPLVRAIFSAAPSVKVLIVDDNSPDGTALAVKNLQKTYSSLYLYERAQKEGLGVAYRAGFRKVMESFPDTEVVMMMDADFYHDPRDLPKLIEASKNYDLVIGSVYAPGGRPTESFSIWRKILSRWGNIYCRIVFGYRLTDWTNAFVAIRMSALKLINLDSLAPKEFAFVFGIKYALLVSGASWKEIGVIALERPYGESKVTGRNIREALFAPLRLRFGMKK